MGSGMNFTRIFIAAGIIAMTMNSGHAMQYDFGRASLRLTGYGTAGIIEPDFDTPNFLGDWRARAQLNYDLTGSRTIGAVYSLDAETVDTNNYIDDAFVLLEDRNIGRVEIGLTDSIAEKLGLGLPDVGGMRVNGDALFYKKIRPHGPIITGGTIDSGDNELRLNIGTRSINGAQYGLSVAGGGDDYKYTADAGVKIKWPAGKLKAAMSFAASFMDAPDNYNADTYAPRLTADWRSQAAWGMNIQYNSWIIGANARAVYDKNAISTPSDGLSAGLGASYDILNYSLSLSYIMSDIGIWHSDADKYIDHTVVGSFRYKYSKNVDGWTSIGWTTKTPFLAAGLRLTF